MLLVRHFLDDLDIRRCPDAPATPRVSVVLPTFARSRSGLLQRAINSILRQTMPDLELLVIDDGSHDGTADLICSYQQRDPRVVHLRHERNCGLPALRCNEGIEHSRGAFIAFQFDDDEWSPRMLEILLGAADSQVRPALICGQARLLWEGHDLVVPLHTVNLGYLSERNYVPNNAVLVPRPFFDRVGMYDPHIAMRRLTDWDLWQRLAEVVPIHTEMQVVATMHAHLVGGIIRSASVDQSLHAAWHEIPRNHLLTPAAWHDYPLDSLRVGNTDLRGEQRRAAYEEQIRPYYLQHRHDLGLTDFPLNVPPRPVNVALRGERAAALLAFDAGTRARDTYRLARSQAVDPRFVDLILADEDDPDLRRASEAGVPVAVVGDPSRFERADACWTSPGGPVTHPRPVEWLPGDPTDPGAVQRFETACRATEFHAATRQKRNAAGRPVVLLVFPDHLTAGYDPAWASRAALLVRHGVDVVAAVPPSAQDSEPGRTVLAGLRAAGVTIEQLVFPAVPSGGTAMLDIAADDIARLEEVLAAHRPVLVESQAYLPAVGVACRQRNIPHLATLSPDFLHTRPEISDHAQLFLGDFHPHDPLNKFAAQGLHWRCLRGVVAAEFFTTTRTVSATGPLNALHRPLGVLLYAPFNTRVAVDRMVAALDRIDLPAPSWTLHVLDAEVTGGDPRISGCPLPNDRQALFAGADLLVLPACEGIPAIVKEAMAAGLLVAAVESSALAGLIHDGQTGLLAPTDSFEHLTLLLHRAVALPAHQRTALEQRAAQVARVELSCARFVADLFETYTLALRAFPERCRRTPGLVARPATTPSLPASGDDTVLRVETFDRPLSYEVVPPGPRWAGLEITVDAEALSFPMPVHLEVLDARGQVVRKASTEVRPGSPGQTVIFHFAPLACTGEVAYTVLLRPSRSRPGAVRLFEVVPVKQPLFARVRRKFLPGLKRTGLACRLLLA
jgi:hypothetical protein